MGTQLPKRKVSRNKDMPRIGGGEKGKRSPCPTSVQTEKTAFPQRTARKQ
jgi:hypothetical protein